MPRRPRTGPLPPARRKRPPRKPPVKQLSRRPQKPPLQVYTILAWADAHRRRTGRWPNAHSGEVPEAPWENWAIIDQALRSGCRGCLGGSSIGLLLYRHRGRPLGLPRPRPRLTIRQILGWADAYHRRTGRWPAAHTPGCVAPDRTETWPALDCALAAGMRGLRGGTTLARLLLRCRGVRRPGSRYRPRLTIRQILAWADAHHARCGRWPAFGTGPVHEARDETWCGIHQALEHGRRGLRPGYTLASLLERRRGAPNKRHRPRLSPDQIVSWADAYHRRHGKWPTPTAGPILGAPNETWRAVAAALRAGMRGLPGGDTIARLLERYGRHRSRSRRFHPPRRHPLALEQILAWADEYFRQNGGWPTLHSGPISGTLDETWESVNSALGLGLRGLPGGSSLAKLLKKHRGVPIRGGPAGRRQARA
ncbi:MAG: hypothetical protein AB1716_08880 [Planctomycetota bacterium]